MSIASDRLFFCALVALASLGWTSGASAQSRVVWSGATAQPECVPLVERGCTADAECLALGESCRVFEDGDRTCASDLDLFCPSEADPSCPVDRPERRALGGLQICASERFVECMDAGARNSCFTSSAGEIPVDWDRGDCDGDGQENGTDPLPCAAPPFIAALDSTGACEPSRHLCAEDSDCGEGLSCRAVVVDDPHHYCVASEGTAFCCGGIVGAECPDAFECTPDEPDALEHCHGYCEELTFGQRTKCLQYLGDFPVDPDLGDCDGDGLRNADELEAGTDPCVGDDGGVPIPEPDAGSAVDAGSAADAGSNATMDGSTEQPPITFSGGGGCRCGIATSHRAAMPWGLVLLALALWRTTITRRRRG